MGMSPRSEIPVNIAACGTSAKDTQSIISGPQAAVIVGDLKLIVECYWRETKHVETAQLYNIKAWRNRTTLLPSDPVMSSDCFLAWHIGNRKAYHRILKLALMSHVERGSHMVTPQLGLHGAQCLPQRLIGFEGSRCH